VLVFPEGTRSLDGNVREFQSGVGLIALRSGARVMPISIEGTRRVWGKGRKFPRLGAGPVRLVFGEPVKYERPTRAEDAAADLRRRVLDLRGAVRQADARDGADARGDAGGGRSA
jgi:1-acyl-sn-glycerol-3-phosphate acyltransferase